MGLIAGVIALCSFLSCSTLVKEGNLDYKSEGKNLADIYYCLPMAKLNLDVTPIKKKVETKDVIVGWDYALSTTFYPDTGKYYGLKINHDALSDDNVTFGTENGLLKTVESTNDDKTGTVVVKMVELAGQIAKLVFNPVGAVGSQDVGEPEPFTEEFDPTQAGFSHINDVLKAHNHDVTLKAGEGKPSDYPEKDSTLPSGSDFKNKIFYKPVFALDVKFFEKANLLKQQTVIVPAGKIFAVDLSRAAFVKKHTKLAFDKGMLNGVTIEQPSQAVAILELPIDVAKALVSIPGELLTFKVTNVNNQTSYLEARQDFVEAKAALEKATAAAAKNP